MSQTTYAIGDIHGKLAVLKLALAWIESEAGNDPAHIIFLGDYVDRGPDSAGVIDLLLTLKNSETRKYTFLMGNHEQMMLDSSSTWVWLNNGGKETLASYGLTTSQIYDIPANHMRFLSKLDLYFEDESRIFVHAGITPMKRPDLSSMSSNILLWIREEFLESDIDYGKIVIHGHTPTPYDPENTFENGDWYPVVRNNRINIDTGCVFGGKLTVAKLTESKHFFMQF